MSDASRELTDLNYLQESPRITSVPDVDDTYGRIIFDIVNCDPRSFVLHLISDSIERQRANGLRFEDRTMPDDIVSGKLYKERLAYEESRHFEPSGYEDYVPKPLFVDAKKIIRGYFRNKLNGYFAKPKISQTR